ncbi:TPA: hypothetical protein N2D99_002210 [Clostridium botulinum]|nr:hypothetical protein [Clostridium botulinum]
MKNLFQETLKGLDTTIKENLIKTFGKNFEGYNESWFKNVNILLNQYLSATEEERDLIDNVITHLCGYSAKTLVDKSISVKEIETDK